LEHDADRILVPANAQLRVVVINEAGHAVIVYSWADVAHYAAWSGVADAVIATLRLNTR
jgi:hypothetical protein